MSDVWSENSSDSSNELASQSQIFTGGSSAHRSTSTNHPSNGYSSTFIFCERTNLSLHGKVTNVIRIHATNGADKPIFYVLHP